MIKSDDKIWVRINKKPIPHDIIHLSDIEKLLFRCGFTKRNKQGGSHSRYKLKGVPNTLIVLAGHGKNPKVPAYQIEQVVKMIIDLDLVEY